MQPDQHATTLDALKSEAARRFTDAGWPTPKIEAWKFTNLERLSARHFTPVTEAAAGGAAAGGAAAGVAGEAARLMFQDGVLAAAGALPAGIELVDLAEDAALAGLLDHPKLKNHPVADQTLASMAGGVGLKVTGAVAAPVEVMYRNAGDDRSSHPVLVVDIAASASLTLVEHHQGMGSGLSLPVMAVRMGEGASLRHARIQDEADERHHLGQAVFSLAGKAVYQGLSVQTGSSLSRAENHISLDGEEAEANLTTLYLARRDQVMDVTTFVAHEAPSCTSMQVIRGVLDDHARGVFQGKVLVAQDAQHTDGNQMSRALLLSRKCEADAKPELEIYADDVTCSHGATVGEIESSHLFYLMSRGIPADEARQMLIEAFLADAIDEVDDPVLAAAAAAPVAQWLATLKEQSR